MAHNYLLCTSAAHPPLYTLTRPPSRPRPRLPPRPPPSLDPHLLFDLFEALPARLGHVDVSEDETEQQHNHVRQKRVGAERVGLRE